MPIIKQQFMCCCYQRRNDTEHATAIFFCFLKTKMGVAATAVFVKLLQVPSKENRYKTAVLAF